MLTDAEDRLAMVETLGDLAELPGGEEIFIILGENFLPVTALDDSGDVGRIYPDCQLTRDDVLEHSIVDGDDGTVIIVLEKHYRIISIAGFTDGFALCELMGL